MEHEDYRAQFWDKETQVVGLNKRSAGRNWIFAGPGLGEDVFFNLPVFLYGYSNYVWTRRGGVRDEDGGDFSVSLEQPGSAKSPSANRTLKYLLKSRGKINSGRNYAVINCPGISASRTINSQIQKALFIHLPFYQFFSQDVCLSVAW